MYDMLCTKQDIYYVVGVVSKFLSNPREEHWIAVKHILKYLRRMRDYMLVYPSRSLKTIGYISKGTLTQKNLHPDMFLLNGDAICWRSVKQTCVIDSTTKTEYVASSEAKKKVVWLKKFLMDLQVIPSADQSISLYYDNNGLVAQSKKPRYHKNQKHIKKKYHLIQDIIQRDDTMFTKIASEDNLVDHFTKKFA